MPETAPDARPRLDGAAVADRMGRLDEALGRLEQTPGATAETAMDAVTMLAEVYGEALSRVMDRACGHGLAGELLDDELLGHLLVLHDVHPEPAERRAARAVDGLRAGLQRGGADAELVAVEERTARVRLTRGGGGGGCGSGCGSGAADVEETVREAILAAAPELTAVEFASDGPAPKPPAFIPVGALLQRAVPAADGSPS